MYLASKVTGFGRISGRRGNCYREVFHKVFHFVLGIAEAKALIAGKTVGVSTTTLEAHAAMLSIVLKDTEEVWTTYVVRLMLETGVFGPEETPLNEEVPLFDRKRKDR
jgi:transposase